MMFHNCFKCVVTIQYKQMLNMNCCTCYRPIDKMIIIRKTIMRFSWKGIFFYVRKMVG